MKLSGSKVSFQHQPTQNQHSWVEDTLENMTLEECVGHLICPEDRDYTPQQWADLVQEIPMGSVFFGPGTKTHYQDSLEAIQSNSRIPVMVASDLEQGCGSMVKGCTRFPFPMAWGACNDPDLMEQMGRAWAVEARSHGIHWSFSPSADLSLNINNPVTNVRAIGDDPYLVSRLLVPLINGLQQEGLLAECAKHFPGDGTDDRDAHLCTTANLLTCDQWWQTYGKVWQSVIDTGVMSIMSAHISFPHYEGDHEDFSKSLPATLSKKLQVDLLRGELGFKGVIVSDAGPMIGMSSRAPADELAVQNILSGSDVYLFARPRKDFKLLMEAVKTGRIEMQQVRGAVRRLLEMKSRLGLQESTSLAETEQNVDTSKYVQLAEDIADKSITVIRNDGNLPAQLKKSDRVLTITIKYPEPKSFLPDELDVIDSELEKRGVIVDHMLNPSHRDIFANADKYEKIFVNIFIIPHSRVGTMRITGELVLPFWRAFWMDYPKAIFTSFGSPYHLYEMPHLPNMILAYGPIESSQRAAVKVWLGEMPGQGICPVRLSH
jgi:beta-N-acetylhexosaminidase